MKGNPSACKYGSYTAPDDVPSRSALVEIIATVS